MKSIGFAVLLLCGASSVLYSIYRGWLALFTFDTCGMVGGLVYMLPTLAIFAGVTISLRQYESQPSKAYGIFLGTLVLSGVAYYTLMYGPYFIDTCGFNEIRKIVPSVI